MVREDALTTVNDGRFDGDVALVMGAAILADGSR